MSDQPKGPGIHRVVSPQQWRDWVREEASRCVKACEAAGDTHYDIAAACGVHRTRVSHWLAKKASPDAGAFEALRHRAATRGGRKAASA